MREGSRDLIEQAAYTYGWKRKSRTISIDYTTNVDIYTRGDDRISVHFSVNDRVMLLVVQRTQRNMARP